MSNKSASPRNRVFALERPLPLRVPSPFRVAQLPSFSSTLLLSLSRALSRLTHRPPTQHSKSDGSEFHEELIAWVPCAGSMRGFHERELAGGEDDEV